MNHSGDFTVEYQEGVCKLLLNLPKAIRERVAEAVNSKLAVDPVRFGKPLRHELKGRRRLRV